MILDLEVCVGGDVFRFQAGRWTQRHNVRVMETLGALISPVRGVHVLTPEALGIDLPDDEQAFWLEHRGRLANADLERKLANRLEGRFYFGFETPPSIWTMACRLCPGAVDIRLHPVRFGEQVLLLARSNGVLDPRPEARHAAKAAIAWAKARLLQERDAGQEAGSPRADLPSRALRPGALLALQVPGDSALVGEAGVRAIEHYAEALAAAAARFDVVYIRTHPFLEPTHETWGAVLGLPNAWVTSETSYALLLSGAIREVLAISSSLLHEAEALGIAATSLDPALSHGYPIAPEHVSIGLKDLIDEIAGFDLVARLDGGLPGVAELFGRPAADRRALVLTEEVAPWPDQPMAGSATELEAAFGHGWNPPEAWGRWSDGSVAALNFLWPAGRGGPLRMTLDLAVFASPGQAGDTVEFWSQGRMLGQVQIGDYRQGVTTVVLDVPAPTTGNRVQLLIVRRDIVCPAEVESSPDVRRLGVALFRICSSAVHPDDQEAETRA